MSDIGKYLEGVRARIHQGAANYGDRSFALPLPRLADEIEQEILDIAGWGYCAWTRLARLRDRMAHLEQELSHLEARAHGIQQGEECCG